MDFQATPDDSEVFLTWSNPDAVDGISIVRSTDNFPESVFEGTNVYQGSAASYLDGSVANDVTYYYSAFSFDAFGNASAPSTAFATPEGTDAPPVSSKLTLYMSTNGSDLNSGLSLSDALLTIEGVQDRLEALEPVLSRDVDVRIEYIPGAKYIRQTVNWTHTSPYHTIRFIPSDYPDAGGSREDIAGLPVFDGEGENDWFFDLRVETGEKTNIEIQYLQIEDYLPGGIRFRGDQNDFGKSNSHNTVRGCKILQIGNKRRPGSAYGYAAVDLVNSDYNTIRANHFIKNENTTADASHMHGVYLAHNSSNNTITNNRFQTISGDPIRIRNYSNYNTFTENDILESGKYAYYSAWRNAETGECRSWKNEFRNNDISCGYSGNEISLFKEFVRWDGNGSLEDGPSYPSGGCTAYSPWLSTSGNIRNCP